MKGLAAAICLLSLTMAGRAALAQDSSASQEPPVKRTLTGAYACTTLEDGSPCGHENWVMTVQGDGTRTLSAYSYVTPIQFQNSTVMRVDANFRPLDGFANLYRSGAFFGSGFFVVDGNELTTTVNAPDKTFSDTMDVPDNVVLLLYPNSAYGWMLGDYDMEAGGVQNVSMCVLAAAQGRSASCVLVDEPLEYVGEESVTVPAGTFDTQHFKIGQERRYLDHKRGPRCRSASAPGAEPALSVDRLR